MCNPSQLDCRANRSLKQSKTRQRCSQSSAIDSSSCLVLQEKPEQTMRGSLDVHCEIEVRLISVKRYVFGRQKLGLRVQ